MELGITLGFEEGICSICKEKKNVRILCDQERKKIVKICESCAEKFGTLSAGEIMDMFGYEE
ncbi:MAG: hypothetical protein OH319_01655 [Candidatus Parvarchaeota archaeon]|nr:hypothetical protein [Candidatus Jingweiarchaeum tengchongense]MCW1297724.1 hypothetical protein [Candidatus Jingweiarchaeum tengchongense]MCW1299734.1 hypothetical protein [Candidatus Jingweiarchaeum tengchongense]MCW1304295.1 hypothetical protein [Candidatus Jingweiarchaeum tengchongense]MCW1305322.1 hypothetical protein [Candidatus Jingweiarchaeum tengchongense]